MTFSAKHATEAVGSYTDDGELGPDDWNHEHVLTMSASFLLGRSSEGNGPVEEIPCTAAGFAMLAAADAAEQKGLLNLAWGDIGGSISSQTDLVSALAGKSNIGHTHTLAAISDAGTAAGKDIGTSGNKVPLLDGANYWSTAQTFGLGTGNVQLAIDGGAGSTRYMNFFSGGNLRWQIGASSGAETGSNAGSSLVFNSYSDAGSYIASPFSVDRQGGWCYANHLYLGDDLEISEGGTGASTAAGARSNLGLVIGTDVAPMPNWMHLTADFTLTSTTSAQKFFNTTANGALTLATGVYEFEWLVHVTGMSATSGNASLDFKGAGTAVVDRIGQLSGGLDNTTPTSAAAIGGAVSTSTSVVAAVAGTGTGMFCLIKGMFRVSTGGTIIPSISLTTAAAAAAKSGSYFKCLRIGPSSASYGGSWS